MHAVVDQINHWESGQKSIENSANPLLDMVLSSVIMHFSIYISEVIVLLPSTPTWAVV